MISKKLVLPLLIVVAVAAGDCCHLTAAEMSPRDAWEALPNYEYGQDMAPLLAIDRVVIQAMTSPQSRATCAAQLGALLASDKATMAAKQYICLQLRQVGTAAEVPVLAQLLAAPKTSEMARYALQAIPGDESAAVLRGALATFKGQLLVGVVNSLSARKDEHAVGTLQQLCDSEDEPIATAAVRALGNIGGEQATALLVARAKQAGVPTPRELAVSLLHCADTRAAAGDKESAKAIFEQLSGSGQPTGARRAALTSLLHLDSQQSSTTTLTWLADPDPDRQLIALGHLQSLPESQLDQLLARLPDLPDAGKLAVIELAAARRGKAILPMIVTMARSDQPELKLAGVRCLGMVGDTTVIPLLVELLSGEDDAIRAAQEALVNLPREAVTAALLDALDKRPDIRVPVIGLLVKLKRYDAIDPLVEIASQPDSAIYEPALDGLRGIADPDKTDIPRLVHLLLKTEPGKHRDEVEKTILIVTEKLPADSDRSELVRAALAGVPGSESSKYLPLLGRLGGAKALESIQSALADADPEISEAAIRGLCNWPNAEVADQLLDLATNSENNAWRRWALRAYIRVVTLDSDRPEAETLAMLQSAMALAKTTDDRQLTLQRASTIRTMPAVNWIADYLDDPDLSQMACEAIVELAHNRFLRHPNMDQFGPILDRVGQISKDTEVVERAKRYRLGL